MYEKHETPPQKQGAIMTVSTTINFLPLALFSTTQDSYVMYFIRVSKYLQRKFTLFSKLPRNLSLEVNVIGVTQFTATHQKEHCMDDQNQIDFDYPNLNTMTADVFYKTYRPFMFSIAKSHGFCQLDAEAIISNLMIKIFVDKKCGYNPKRGPFRYYLAAMTRNECRSFRLKEKRFNYLEEKDIEKLCDDNEMFTPMSGYSRGTIEWIEEGVRRLRKEVRSQIQVDAFIMMVIGRMSPTEVSEELNVRPDYVSVAKIRLHPRFKAILREIENED